MGRGAGLRFFRLIPARFRGCCVPRNEESSPAVLHTPLLSPPTCEPAPSFTATTRLAAAVAATPRPVSAVLPQSADQLQACSRRLRMTCSTNVNTAATGRRWMKPPSVIAVTRPKSQSTIKRRATDPSIGGLGLSSIVAFGVPLGPRIPYRIRSNHLKLSANRPHRPFPAFCTDRVASTRRLHDISQGSSQNPYIRKIL